MRQLRKLEVLSRYFVHALDGDIGQIRQVYFDDRDWQVRYFVVRTGNWLLGRDVLLLPDVFASVDDEQQRIEVELKREQIQDAPPVDDEMPISRHYEQELFVHYGWKPYWDGDPSLGLGSTVPPPAEGESVREPANPHLRASEEVEGYRIRTKEGNVGEVRDFLLQDHDWKIRYLDVVTGNWFFGREVLIACAWLESIDWTTRNVVTVLTREAIENAPRYKAGELISREYEIALYKHYGQDYIEND